MTWSGPKLFKKRKEIYYLYILIPSISLANFSRLAREVLYLARVKDWLKVMTTTSTTSCAHGLTFMICTFSRTFFQDSTPYYHSIIRRKKQCQELQSSCCLGNKLYVHICLLILKKKSFFLLLLNFW